MSERELFTFELYGWWDVFNEFLYEHESDAKRAMEGGNEVLKLYRLKVETK